MISIKILNITIYLLIMKCIIINTYFVQKKLQPSIFGRFDRSDSYITYLNKDPIGNNLQMMSLPIIPDRAIITKNTKLYDNPIEKVWIYLLSKVLTFYTPNRTIANQYLSTNYTGFVSISKLILQDTTPLLARKRIVTMLKTIMPFFIKWFFRFSYKYFPKFICEKCSLFMSFNTLSWLVGPSERFALLPSLSTTNIVNTTTSSSNYERLTTNNVTILSNNRIIDETNPSSLTWLSGVKLLECRYLRESGCKANCVHLCKGPTQEFFTQDLGLPLYMKPNFTDYSCELQFGVRPLADDIDPAYQEQCYITCPVNKLKTELKC